MASCGYVKPLEIWQLGLYGGPELTARDRRSPRAECRRNWAPSPIVRVHFGAHGLSRPLAPTGCPRTSRCRLFALQDWAISPADISKNSAIPLTGKSLLVVFDA